MSADGVGTSAIMAQTGTAKTTVWRGQARFMEEGVDGLLREDPSARQITRHRRQDRDARDHDAEAAPFEATHWTARAMAKIAGLAVFTVQKIWKAHGLAPHR